MLSNTFIVFVCFRIYIAIAPLRSLYRECQSTTPYFAFYLLSILTASLCLNSLVSCSIGFQKVTTTELACLLHTHSTYSYKFDLNDAILISSHQLFRSVDCILTSTDCSGRSCAAHIETKESIPGSLLVSSQNCTCLV